jgi:hypothetical protein
VERKFQCRCDLPQCHTPDTGGVHRNHRSSGMGYTILCDADREGCQSICLSYSQSMMQGVNVTYKIGVDQVSRGQFTRNGTLDNQEDQNFRPINQSFSVFAISRDFGTVQSTQAPVVWTVGYTTDPAVNYTDLSGAPPTHHSPYYKTKYSNDEAMASIDDIS